MYVNFNSKCFFSLSLPLLKSLSLCTKETKGFDFKTIAMLSFSLTRSASQSRSPTHSLTHSLARIHGSLCLCVPSRFSFNQLCISSLALSLCLTLCQRERERNRARLFFRHHSSEHNVISIYRATREREWKKRHFNAENKNTTTRRLQIGRY